ncbi:unnamed protein product, partial [Cladocopium goreaui]
MAAYSPGSAPAAFNLLAAAKRIWNDVGPEIKASDTLKEGPLLPPEDLKQVCKYLQSTVTKFSASATVVADAEEAQRSLTPIAEEVIKAYTMLVGTLLRINSGAGYSLSKELKDAGDNLTEAVNALGMAVCTSSLAPSAGKVLEHVTALEKSSTQNRAAIMRRLLKSLAQLRDANREMAEELEAPDSGNSGPRAEVFSGDEELLEDDDDLSIPPMDPSERTLLENVRCVSEHFEDLVKEDYWEHMPELGVCVHHHLQPRKKFQDKPKEPQKMKARAGEPAPSTVSGSQQRAGADLKSSELGRLPYGAVLLQKELRGERLGFQLLRGAGPLEGYVSLRIKGKELLQKCLVPLDPPETHVPNVSMEVEMPTHCLTSLLDFQRVANFRDLAEGLGARVALRPGKLFRTGHFAAALREDLGRLDALGIRTCVDLRDGLDFEGADAPVYDIFPPRPRSPRSVPSAEPGTRRRLWCPFSKDLKLRSWSSEEKLGLVPQHHRRAWHSWWYRGDGQAAEPAGNVGEGYQRYVRLFMEKKVEVNQASNLCALNRAILLVNSDEVLKAMKALSEVPWQRGLGSKDQNKCTRLYWLRAQGRFLLANAKEKNYPVAFGCVAGQQLTNQLP